METKIVEAIHDHFRFEIKRPELINRIGQNIVVFEFIRATTARLIFEAILARVLLAVREEHGVSVEFTREALAEIEERATRDVFDGGRGIGNRIETVFINPLSHVLFERPGLTRLRVTGLSGHGHELRLKTEAGN
jgi:ATP-dependent Clp protease ATP-binding subunit ClpA